MDETFIKCNDALKAASVSVKIANDVAAKLAYSAEAVSEAYKTMIFNIESFNGKLTTELPNQFVDCIKNALLTGELDTLTSMEFVVDETECNNSHQLFPEECAIPYDIFLNNKKEL